MKDRKKERYVMKRRKGLITIAALLVIAIVAAVAPTYSWLSAQSDKVVNTFAGGAISILLDESPVGTDGKKIEGNRTTANSYKYKAGAVLDKDPRVTVIKGSEECYVFLCVENGLNDKFAINYDTSSWLKVAESGEKSVYAYKQRVNALEATENKVLEPIFTTVTISEDLTSEDILQLGQRTLSVTAYAVQTEPLTSAEAIDIAVANFLGEGVAANHVTIG